MKSSKAIASSTATWAKLGVVSVAALLSFGSGHLWALEVVDSSGSLLSNGPSVQAIPGTATHTAAFVGQESQTFTDGSCTSGAPAEWAAEAAGTRFGPIWTFLAQAVTMSSPRFADVDGDGIQEIIQATMGALGSPYGQGRIYVFRRDGTDLPGWPVIVASPFTSSCPAIADLDGDGDMEIVAQSWSSTYVWNADGTNFPGWPKAHGTGSSVSAALADLDSDGDLEIICPTGSTLNVWHHDGTLFSGWPFVAPKLISPPAVADIDGDGELEIAAGCWEGPYPGSGPFPFYVFKADGTHVPGFPIADPGGQTRGAISLGDLDDNGSVEIVARINDCIRVWNAQGQMQPGWPVCPDLIRNSATGIGDMDGDGDFEVVIAGYQAQAFHHDGSPVAGWPVAVPPGTSNINSGLVIADVDGDPAQREVVVHSANTFTAFHANGSYVTGFPFNLSDDGQSGTFSAAPAIGDLDGNGMVEYVFVSASGRIAYFDESLAYAGDANCWPVMQHDAWNTSFLNRTDPAEVVSIPRPTGGLQLSFPNPARSGCSFRLETLVSGMARIEIFDLDGRLVCELFSGAMGAETRTVVWNGRAEDGRPVSAGVYFLSARVGDLAERRIVVLMP